MNNNLFNIIAVFRKDGLTYDQILSSLLGMGMVENIVREHIDMYKQIEDGKMKTPEYDARGMEVETPSEEDVWGKANTVDRDVESMNKRYFNKKIKENVMNNFTTLQLYENIMQTNESLKEFSRNNEENSYSAMTASSILERALATFPHDVTIQEARKIQGLPVDESNINASLKYEIADNIYNMLSKEWIAPVKKLCGYLAETMENDKWGYVASRAMNACTNKLQNNMYAALYEQLGQVLKSEDHESALLKLVTEQAFWSPECKNIVSLIEKDAYAKNDNVINKTVVENNNCSMMCLFSPVMKTNEGFVFNLWGKNYSYDGHKLTETKVDNERYNFVVNGLSLMSYNDNDKCLEYYGANGKVLEYDIVEEKLHIGNKDLSEMSSIDLSSALRMSGLFERYNFNDIDTLVRMFENRQMIAQLDQCVNIKPETLAGIYLTIFAVEEGVYVNRVDFKNRINEMKYFNSAIEARNFVKESVGYDATLILKEQIKNENQAKAALAEKRNEIKDNINFLKEKRQMVVQKIADMPNNVSCDELKEALNILECEIYSQEKELENTFTSGCENCVPMRLKNVCGTLGIGDVVYVDAVLFNETPEDGMINVTNPADGSTMSINKSDIVVDINEPETEVEVSAEQPVMPTAVAPTQISTGTGMVNDCKSCK